MFQLFVEIFFLLGLRIERKKKKIKTKQSKNIDIINSNPSTASFSSMSEQVKINPDLLIILVGSVINKCISEYKGDYKDCKALFPVNKFILDLNNLTQEYTTKFPNIDIHFPQIDIKLLSFIITKTLYHKFVTVTQDHVIIDVLPHAYENYLKNIVATSTLRYAKYLLKSAKDLYELEQKKLRKEKGGVSLQGNAPKETIPTLQQQSATPNEKQEVVVPPQVKAQPPKSTNTLKVNVAENKVDTIKESKPISNVPEPTKVQPKPQNSDNKDSTVSEKPSPNESTSLLVTKEKSEEKVVDEDQTMESSEDQKNEEQDLQESKELSNTDTDKMDIDEPQKPIDDKTSEKVEEEINQDQDQEMSDEGEEESAGVEEQPKTLESTTEPQNEEKVAENENEVGVPSDESKQDEVALEEKQTDEEAEKPIESIEENDEKNKENVIIEEDKEEEILKTKESEQEQEDKDEEREIGRTEQDESDEKVEETGKTEEETNKEEDAHQPSSPEEESPSIEEIPLKHELDADIEAIPGSDSSKEATPEVKQSPKTSDDQSSQESPEKSHDDVPSPPPPPSASSSASRKRARSRSPLPVPAQQHKRFQNIAINLLNSIQEHRFSSPFLQPVSVKDAPDYYNVVREPRDLKNIMKAVKSKNEPPLYQSVKELERDIMLMFANCIMYNQSGDDLVELTKTMKQDISEVFKMFEEAEEDIK